MKKDDVFNFEDFLNRNDKVIESIVEETIEEIISEVKEEIVENIIEIKESVLIPEPEKEESPIVEDNYYKLYKDKGDEFTCDIMIEGSSVDDTYVRIILESDDWSLIFPGTIKNGKCVVPIKKLGILKEGDIGKIKLEVVAEGNLFIPWEDEFKVKLSKKVTVNLNESKQVKESGVRVNVNK